MRATSATPPTAPPTAGPTTLFDEVDPVLLESAVGEPESDPVVVDAGWLEAEVLASVDGSGEDVEEGGLECVLSGTPAN